MELSDALEEVISTAEGRKVISTILNCFGDDVTVFDCDTVKRDFLLGQQSVATWLRHRIQDLGDFTWAEFLIALKKDELNGRTNNESDE